MNPKASALAVFAAAWCAISYNAPTAEGMQSFAAFDWGKLIGAVVPAVIALFTGGGNVPGLLRTLLAAFGIVLPEPKPPVPVPVPEPDEDRPILSLLRRLIDLFVSEGRFSEAGDAMELYKGCCEQHRDPVEARKP